jgi:hypothetical protein
VKKKKEKSAEGSRPRPETKTRFDGIEKFAREHPVALLVATLVIGLILALLLFDVKPSTGGDDTAYLLQAHSLVSKGILPVGFKSPGYPSVLAVFVFAFGLNVVLLKSTSLLFFLASLASFFYIFRKRLEPFTFFSVLILFGLNALALDYAHQTYSEMLFLLVELWTIYFVWIQEDNPEGISVRGIFLVSFFAMTGFYVRAIGATLPLSVGIWYVYQKRWKALLWFGAFCVLLYVPWKIAEYSQGIVMMGQASDVLMINPYNPALGGESLGGFVERFLKNMMVHLNYMFPKALSLPTAEHLGVADGRLIPDGTAFLGVVFSTVLIVGIVRAIRRLSKEMRFLALYFLVYIFSICFALQTLYATPRMLVPMVPIVLLLFFLGVHEILHYVLRTGQNRTSSFKGWIVFVSSLVLLSNVVTDVSAVDNNMPTLKANLRGDQFAGYSPDWVNYLQATQWISRNLPKDSVGVICRKPELFQIYSGGFYTYGTYTVESTVADSIVAHWKGWRMTHLLYDNFQWSSTLRRYVQPVADKYPKVFELVHQEGTQYPSYVFRLNYAATDTTVGGKDHNR